MTAKKIAAREAQKEEEFNWEKFKESNPKAVETQWYQKIGHEPLQIRHLVKFHLPNLTGTYSEVRDIDFYKETGVDPYGATILAPIDGSGLKKGPYVAVFLRKLGEDGKLYPYNPELLSWLADQQESHVIMGINNYKGREWEFEEHLSARKLLESIEESA